jgi:pilus assembly protein FimV
VVGSANGAATTESSAERDNSTAGPITEKAEQTMSWFQEHLLGVMGALLAFIVLVIAWLLRRANASRDDDAYGGTAVTEAMVREKLQNINLDLTPTGENATQRSE